MNTKEAQIIAAKHFCENYTVPSAKDILLLFQRFENKIDEGQTVIKKSGNRLRIKMSDDDSKRFFTWYYFNYIYVFKEGDLTLRGIVDTALLKLYSEHPNRLWQSVFEEYAKEELKLNKKKAYELALVMLEKGITKLEDRFCYWYYLNYIVKRIGS